MKLSPKTLKYGIRLVYLKECDGEDTARACWHGGVGRGPRGRRAGPSIVPADSAHRQLRHAPRMGGLPRGGTPVPYRAGGLYVRLVVVPAVWRHLRQVRIAHRGRREFHHRDAWTHRQSRQPARCGLYTAAQQSDLVSPRRLSLPVLRRPVPLQPAVARPRDALQPRRSGPVEQRRVGLPPLQQRQGIAHARAGGHGTAGGAVHPPPMPNTSI